MTYPLDPEHSNHDSLAKLIEMAYDAAGDAAKWEVFLAAYTQRVHAVRGSLVLYPASGQAGSFSCFHGWSGSELAYYREHYATQDAWNQGARAFPEGAVGRDTDLCPREVSEACLAYREFYAPRGMAHGMGATILVSDGGKSLIIVMRGPDLGPFGDPQLALTRSLLPHLRRAAILHGEISSLRSQLSVFTAHLDRYPQPFLLVGSECQALFANHAAQALLNQHRGLWIGGEGVSSNPELRKALRQMIAKPSERFRSLQIPNESDGRSKSVLITRVQQTGAVPLGTSQPALAIVIVDPEQGLGLDSALLHELFSITPAEAKILARLVAGRSFDEIATETGIAIGTVRTHVKRIFAKTGTTRQGELISLILRAMPFQA